MSLILRPYVRSDEDVARRAHAELAAEGVVFLWGLSATMSWDDYLQRAGDCAAGRHLPEGHVPTALLAAEVDAEIVGRVSVRYDLTDHLREYGGHVGYVVRPAYPRRGYATEILRQGVDRARERGIEAVLVTCDDTNVASARVIERVGGVLASVIEDPDGARVRRYWITPDR